MSLLPEECSVLGVLVPTKAVLYRLILSTCEGSISHWFFMIQQLGIVSKHHNMAQITDESYLYNGVAVRDTV